MEKKKSKSKKTTKIEFDFRTINSVEKAFKQLNMKKDAIPDLSKVPEEFRAPLMGFYNLIVSKKAINGDWKADYSNLNQKKWVSWFDLSSGCRFDGSFYGYSLAYSHFGPRLCSEDLEHEEFFAKTFIKEFEKIFK